MPDDPIVRLEKGVVVITENAGEIRTSKRADAMELHKLKIRRGAATNRLR